MIQGRAMYIWHLEECGSIDEIMIKAQDAKLSSLWVKIGDGTRKFDNIKGNEAKRFRELIARCSTANISVLGYHVPWCANVQDARNEVNFIGNVVRDFGLSGVVVDNEDGSSYFRGNAQSAEEYGQALQTTMRSVNKLVVMSSNDIISVHRKAYGQTIGKFVDLNAPQVYYGQSPSVDSRLNWAIRENKVIAAPFFPVGAAFMRKPTDNDGGFLDPEKCARAAAQFIKLMSLLHHSDPKQYPGYGFWNWEEAPQQVWSVLNTADVFVAPRDQVNASSLTLPDDTLSDFADMQVTTDGSLPEILQLFDRRADCESFIGMKLPDLNLPRNVLLVESETTFHSFRKEDIIDDEILPGRKERLWVKKGTYGWRSNRFAVGGAVKLRDTSGPTEDLREPATIDVSRIPRRVAHTDRTNLFQLGLELDVAAILPSSFEYEVLGSAILDGRRYVLLDQFDEESGGQVLIASDADSPAEVVAADSVLFADNLVDLPLEVARTLVQIFGLSVEATTAEPSDRQPLARDSETEVNRRVFQSALDWENRLSSRNVPGTNHGRRACARAVNEVVRRALGHPIGGGLQTSEMLKVLDRRHKPIDVERAEPGNIIISPTIGGVTGHVGIVGERKGAGLDTTRVYSNSSSKACFVQNYTFLGDAGTTINLDSAFSAINCLLAA